LFLFGSTGFPCAVSVDICDRVLSLLFMYLKTGRISCKLSFES
jgi:hypothetical protein